MWNENISNENQILDVEYETYSVKISLNVETF